MRALLPSRRPRLPRPLTRSAESRRMQMPSTGARSPSARNPTSSPAWVSALPGAPCCRRTRARCSRHARTGDRRVLGVPGGERGLLRRAARVGRPRQQRTRHWRQPLMGQRTCPGDEWVAGKSSGKVQIARGNWERDIFAASTRVPLRVPQEESRHLPIRNLLPEPARRRIRLPTARHAIRNQTFLYHGLYLVAQASPEIGGRCPVVNRWFGGCDHLSQTLP